MQEYSETDKLLEIYDGLDIRNKGFKKKTYDGMKQHRSPVNWMEMKPLVKSAHPCKSNQTTFGNYDAILFG